MSRNTVGVAFTLLSGVGVIFLPTTAKLAYESGSNLITVAFARGVIATLLLLLAVLVIRQSLRLPRALLRPSLIAGIGGAIFVYGIYGAINTINISLAVLILYLYPIVLAIYEHLTGSIRVRKAQWFWGLAACCGLALILGARLDQTSLVGVALAMLAMLASVLITVTNVKVAASVGSLVSNLYMSLWGMLIFSLVLLLAGEFQPPRDPTGWMALLGNGTAYCVAWVAFFSGARILGATRASMLTLVEPPTAALVAWLVFEETFNALQWVGFATVLVSLLMFEILARADR
jgi:drug/metabolite transporter (DMT)-like permease